MKLFVDVGNTFMKWRMREGDRVRQGSRAHERDWPALARELSSVATEVPREIHIASVAGPEGDRLLRERLTERFGREPAFYYSEAQACGVRNAYSQARRLGVDRWLAVIEAWHRHGEAIVIDCGSAVTVDAVAGARHLGGYIVPGLAMLRGGLLQNTADVHVSAVRTPSLAPGSSTTEGVENGILLMSVAFITRAVVELRRSLPDTCSVLLTGGDAPALMPWLDEAPVHVPDLVLDGLERRVTAGLYAGGE